MQHKNKSVQNTSYYILTNNWGRNHFIRPTLWIPIYLIWIRILNFGPIWPFLNYKKKMATETFYCQFSLWILSSILHYLPLIYPIFTCVDPDPYKDPCPHLKTNPICIRIQNTAHPAMRPCPGARSTRITEEMMGPAAGTLVENQAPANNNRQLTTRKK